MEERRHSPFESTTFQHESPSLSRMLDGCDSPQASDALIGAIFAGKYEILECLGEGGMSRVYKARHVFVDKLVAVKVLLPTLAFSERSFKRFQQEAKAAASVKHPNAVEVNDFGFKASGEPFIVMDYLDGVSLNQMIKSAPLPADKAIEYIVQACNGLGAAHAKGIIHRDIKPSNIMIVRQQGTEVVKIVDFGVAKVLSQEDQTEALTQTGEFFGTPAYMAPEQWGGASIDARADIYSLGCVIYHAITGSAPFSGSLLEVMQKQRYEAPPPLVSLQCSKTAQTRLEAIILKAMAKDPRERYQSVNELASHLQMVFSSENVISHGLAWLRIRLLRRARISAPTIAALICTLVVLALAWLQVSGWRERADRNTALAAHMDWYEPPPPPPQIANANDPELYMANRMLTYLRHDEDPVYVIAQIKQAARHHYNFGRYAEVEDFIDRFLAQRQTNPSFGNLPDLAYVELYNMLGDCYVRQKLYEPAIKWFEKAQSALQDANAEERYYPTINLADLHYRVGMDSTGTNRDSHLQKARELYETARNLAGLRNEFDVNKFTPKLAELELTTTPYDTVNAVRLLNGYLANWNKNEQFSKDIVMMPEAINPALANYYLAWISFTNATQDGPNRSRYLDNAIEKINHAESYFKRNKNLNRLYLAKILDLKAKVLKLQNHWFEAESADWRAFSIRAFE